jgi:glycosyltransferase involved in cell wall biosynthesis
MNKFSIVMPVFNRAHFLPRAINSILTQTYGEWELIVIDDGSTDAIDDVMKFYATDTRITYLKQIGHFERVRAQNLGFKKCTGNWQTWLDSDDVFLPTYLETVNAAIYKYGDFDVCNFGAIVIHDDFNVTFRPTFKPERKGEGHVSFPSGDIGAGSFVYKTEVWNSLKYFGETHFPEVNDPYQFADAMKEKFPEIKEFYGDKEIGNPWGNDVMAFYMLTRNHYSRPLDTALYLQLGKNAKQWN